MVCWQLPAGDQLHPLAAVHPYHHLCTGAGELGINCNMQYGLFRIVFCQRVLESWWHKAKADFFKCDALNELPHALVRVLCQHLPQAAPKQALDGQAGKAS